YTYKVCPLRDVSQDSSSLGRWKGWGGGPGGQRGGEGEEKAAGRHPPMLYADGSLCHGLGKRSAEVKVDCGPEHALVAAEEPHTCFYQLRLETPLGCTSGLVQEAERRLA
ncbi:unnamed protein product, partial [Discosporangium mesarthrocarpum]